MKLSNGELAELLAAASEQETEHRARALRRASRAALQWPEEAEIVAAEGRSLTELRTIGPWTAHMIEGWLEEPPELPPPSPLRTGFLTLAQVRAALAEHPEYRSEVRGDLQMHTTYSDGRAPLREMAETAATYGYDYVAVTDHSVGLPIANGMSEDQTDRYLAAVRNPDVDVLAHPRGRRWNHRLGLTADWPRVFEAAVEAHIALEIDAYPDRQDLDVELLRLANDVGSWISIGTDAHHPDELRYLEFGLAAAALASIPTSRILNFQTEERLLQWAGGEI